MGLKVDMQAAAFPKCGPESPSTPIAQRAGSSGPRRPHRILAPLFVSGSMRFRDSARNPCLLGTDFWRPGSGPDPGNHWVTGDTTGTDHVTESAPGRRARGAGLESCHRDSRGSMARKGARHMGTSAPTRGLSGCGWPGQKEVPVTRVPVPGGSASQT